MKRNLNKLINVDCTRHTEETSMKRRVKNSGIFKNKQTNKQKTDSKFVEKGQTKKRGFQLPAVGNHGEVNTEAAKRGRFDCRTLWFFSGVVRACSYLGKEKVHFYHITTWSGKGELFSLCFGRDRFFFKAREHTCEVTCSSFLRLRRRIC